MVIYFFFNLLFIGQARISPANAPQTVVFRVEDVYEQAESQPKREAQANPAALPIIVTIAVIFMYDFKKKFHYTVSIIIK